MDQTFKKLKAVIAQNVFITYPDLNVLFNIYTDASDHQVGSCVMQIGRSVLYFSKNLTSTQKNFATMEKELLAIVFLLIKLHTAILGAKLNIYTDHKNLTSVNSNTQSVLMWCNIVEEYTPNIFYLEGKLNVLADAFSRLMRFDDI